MALRAVLIAVRPSTSMNAASNGEFPNAPRGAADPPVVKALETVVSDSVGVLQSTRNEALQLAESHACPDCALASTETSTKNRNRASDLCNIGLVLLSWFNFSVGC